MKIGQALLPFYSTSLSVVVLLGAFAYSLTTGNVFFFLFFLPIVVHFLLTYFNIKTGYKIFLYYSFIFVTIMVMMGFVTASNVPQLVSAFLFCPLAFYFWSLVFPKTSRPLIIPAQAVRATLTKKVVSEEPAQEEAPEVNGEETEAHRKVNRNFDQNRRMFLKLIGSAGLGVLIYSLISKKASLPFFDSSPESPETISLKDSLGNPVDPATRQPTDGYKVAEVDDSSPTFFGFVEKPDKWFIMQISDSGAIRYTKGQRNFSANWDNRANLTYDYYDAVF